MTEMSALCLPLQDLGAADRPDVAAPDIPTLRISPPASHGVTTGEHQATRLVVLRNPDLFANLRRARAARFASRYEWLALRRRRAQIAARHELAR